MTPGRRSVRAAPRGADPRRHRPPCPTSSTRCSRSALVARRRRAPRRAAGHERASSSSTSSRSCSPRRSTRTSARRSCRCSWTRPPNPMPSCGSSSRCGPTSRPTARLRRLRRGHQGTHDRARRDVGGRAGRGGPPARRRRRRRGRAGARRPDHGRGRRRSRVRSRSSSTTMAELFAQRTANVITLAAYDESGGLAGAIGRRAEAIYAELDDRRAIGGAGGVPPPRQRGRRPRGHPPPGAPDRAGAAGVAPTSSTGCCASTAATGCSRSIATRPPGHRRSRSPTRRCSASGRASRAGSTTHARTCSPAGGSNRPPTTGSRPDPIASFLFTGGRLELAESWAAESGFELTDDEQRFLTASRTRVDRDTAARARRRRRIVEVLVGIAVVTAAVAAYALVQRSAADREARDDPARELAGQAQLAIEEDPERAIMLALAASETTSEPLPESGLGAPGGDAVGAARRQGRRRRTAVSRTARTARWSRSIHGGREDCRAHRSGERRRAGRGGDPIRSGLGRSGLRSRRRRAGRGLRRL